MIPLKKWFSKHQNKPKFNNLDDSGVLSSDFPGLRVAAVIYNFEATFIH